MKKLFYLFAIITVAFGFTACGSDDETEVPQIKNQLVGTKWHTSYADYIMLLEFTSENQVQGYFAKDNGSYYTGRTTGSYKITGDKVLFSNIEFVWVYAHYKLEEGNLSGSLLSTKGQQTFNVSKGEWSAWNETWNKQ